MKDPRALIELIEDLNEDELNVLAYLVGGLDRLEMEEGASKYTEDEIDLIGRFADVPEADDDEDEDKPDPEDAVDEDGEPQMPGLLAAERNFQENSFAPES